MKRLTAALLLALSSLPAAGHPLAPALLELQQTGPAAYSVLWRLSAVQPTAVTPRPVLPAHCRPAGGIQTLRESGTAVASRWQLQCEHSLAGERIAVEGLTASGINVIVRFRDSAGLLQQTLLDAGRPAFTVNRPDNVSAQTPTWQHYLTLGVEHLWFGPDHLLFVLGLMLLVRRFKPLVLTLTAFTLGHSVTLSLATLGLLTVSQALMEFGIALSLIALARELLRRQLSLLGRRPGLMAFSFGLLHGLGFAGALGEIGLPQDAIVPALLAFNCGIELGQLAVVAVVCGLLYLWRLASSPAAAPARDWRLALPAYLIGGMAALWCLERLEGALTAII